MLSSRQRESCLVPYVACLYACFIPQFETDADHRHSALQTYPEPPGYYLGRFSNGETWIEVAAKQLGVKLSNYAAGGATTGIVYSSGS